MKPSHILLGILIAVIWSGNLIASKVAAVYMPPLLLSTARFVTVSALILPFSRRISIPWYKVFVMAQIWGTLYFALFFTGFYLGVSASVASIGLQMSVPLTAIFGMLFLKERVIILKWLGIIISCIGVYVMKDTPNLLEHPTGFFLMLMAAFSWAVASLLIKYSGEDNPVALTGWMALCATPLLFALSFASHILPFMPHEWERLPEMFSLRPEFIAAFLYMNLAGSLAGNIGWLYLLRHNPASQVMSFLLLVPVCGVLFSALLLDEPLTPPILLGGALVVVGMAMIILRKRQKPLPDVYPE